MKTAFCDHVTMDDNAWTFALYSFYLTIRCLEQNKFFSCWFDNDVIETIVSRFPECLKQYCSNNLRDGVKIQVYIQYSDTNGVHTRCTIHVDELQGPWVK